MKNNYHTIKSGIVKDALHAISSNPLEDSYIGGGISLQFTLPDEYHRVTSDIDLSTSRHIITQNFRDYATETFKPLEERGYSLNIRKRNATLDAHLERDNDHLMVQVPRRSKNNHTLRKKLLEREVSNARIVPYLNGNFKVIAYEDLIGHKVLRSTTFMTKYNLIMPQNNNPLLFMNALNSLKNEFDSCRFTLTPEELSDQVATIRLHADIFDIQMMFTLFGENMDSRYLNEVLDSYSATKEQRKKWESLIETIQNRI